VVVPEAQVDTALSNYFGFANLAALRELAQLWLDPSVPDPVAAFAAHRISEPVQEPRVTSSTTVSTVSPRR